MASIPKLFKSVLYALVTAITTSYEEPSGAQTWRSRYSDLIAQSPIDPVALHLPRHPEPKGVYKHNNSLRNLVKLGDGQLVLPEDLAVDPSGAFLYVSCGDGWVRKYHLSNGVVEEWAFVGGRPLGIAVDNAGDVVVCEPVQGRLIKINKDTATQQILSTAANGLPYGIIDEVTIASNNLVYFTDASFKYNFSNYWYDNLESRPHGRLLVYDPATTATTVLLNNLQFPNGVALTKSQSSLIFCETTLAKCSKVVLTGPESGTVSRFVENLPGLPDNIHANEAGDRYYIALLGNRDALTDFVSEVPALKALLAADEKLYGLYSNTARVGRVLEVDASGAAIRVFEDARGAVIAEVTTGVPYGEALYVSGLRASIVGRVAL